NSIKYQKDVVADVQGDPVIDGLQVFFRHCSRTPAPVKIAQLDLDDRGSVLRDNLVIELQGAKADSLLESKDPQLRICDPGDPLMTDRGRIRAPTINAVLNCTVHCGCTTAVRPRTWSE